MKSKGYLYFKTGSNKRLTRAVVGGLNKIFIQKKTNDEFD
jgi:hypothetical protein